ncbi:MAG: hypothetical protein M1497_15460 [Nitrospirae bacterium]|nr:hypothetical protein [Nitrospirota bacterium]
MRGRKLQTHIEVEIDNHVFDPSRYVKSEQERFYFARFAEAWLRGKEQDVKQGLRAQSYVKELLYYNKKYFCFFGNRDIRDLRRYDMEEFKNSLPSHISPKTIKNVLIALKNLFMTAYRHELIEKVPSFPSIDVPEYSGWKWIDAETQIDSSRST